MPGTDLSLHKPPSGGATATQRRSSSSRPGSSHSQGSGSRPSTAPTSPAGSFHGSFDAGIGLALPRPGTAGGGSGGDFAQRTQAVEHEAYGDDVDDKASVQSLGSLSEGAVQASYGAWARAVFRVADVDGSGELTINELKSMLHGTEHMVRVVRLVCAKDCSAADRHRR